jgi:hypothetical protein
MRLKPFLALFLAFVALGPFPAGAALAADACADLADDSPVVQLSGVDAAGDPVLADGRRLRLVGLAPRQDEAEAQRFVAGLGGWRGQDLALVLLGPPDRWGRLPARLFARAEGQEPRNLAETLIAEGAALALPEARPTRCGGAAPTRTTRAAASRRSVPVVAGASASVGPDESVLDSHDLAALRAHQGRIVVIGGRVASVGERAQRTYLNFSRRRGEAASIVLSKTLWRALQDAGWTASGLAGKRLRARGVLSGRDGLLLDVTSMAALERVD